MKNEEMALLFSEATPYIQKYHGKTMVIKYGGNAMTDPDLQAAFAQDIVLLQSLGIYPVVVHGGGPQIDAALKLVGKEGQFIQGMRVTDAATMQVVQWVLLGQVQPELVGHINAAAGKAVACGKHRFGRILAQRVPLAAIGALPLPAKADGTAGSADIAACGFGHRHCLHGTYRERKSGNQAKR